MNKKIIISILLTGIMLNSGYAQGNFESKTGTTVATFLKIGQSPRAMGVGEAYVALGTGASSAFWNPAGIVVDQTRTLSANYTDWIIDLQLSSLAVSLPLDDQSSAALTAIALNMDDIDVTTVKDPNGDGTRVGAGDIALGASYARKLTETFNLGITGKLIHSNIARESATGLAVDIGTYYLPGWRGLRVGMTLSNLGTKMRMDGRDLDVKYDTDPLLGSDVESDARLKTNDWDLPTTFRLGVAMDVLKSNGMSLTVSADGIHASDTKERFAVGTELNVGHMIALRLGTGLNYDQSRFSGGIGLHTAMLGGITVDYAFTTLEPFGLMQTLGVSYNY